MPKATYMYWQKRFDRGNPDQEIEEKVLEIREEHKNYGYRRILGDLRNQGYSINKKKVQRIVQRRKSPSSHGGENPHAIAIMEQGILFYADAVHKNDPGF